MTGRRLPVTLAVAGCVGAVTPFVPFAAGVSPLSAASRPLLFLLGLPFFLAIPVSIAMLRLVAAKHLSRPEAAICYSAAAVSAAMTAAALGYAVLEVIEGSDAFYADRGSYFLALLGLPALAFPGVAWVHAGRKAGSPVAPILAMQVAYAANALLCFTFYWFFANAAASLTAATVLVYACHAVTVRSESISEGGEQCPRTT